MYRRVDDHPERPHPGPLSKSFMSSESLVGGKAQRSAAFGVIWTIAANQSENLLAFANTIVLARLLSPADFGIVAIASSVVALGEIFVSFGFDWALLRIREPTRTHYDSAWTLRALCGLIVFACLSAAAVPASSILQQPDTLWLIISIAATGFIGSLQNIGIVDFRRSMQLHQEFKLRLWSKAAGVGVAILAAILTGSYWSLVIGSLAWRLTYTIMSYTLHEFRPKIDLSCWRELLSFSVWMLFGRIMDVFRSRFSEMWLGRNLGASSAGFYTLASDLSVLASSEISAPVQRVMFIRYAEHANTPSLLRDAFLRVNGVVWAISFPAAVGIGVCADHIVNLLLGSQWSQSASILRVLAIAGVIAVMGSSTQMVYMATGRAKFSAFLSTLGAVAFILLTIVLGAKIGIQGVALAQIGAVTIALAANYWVLCKALPNTILEMLKRNVRIVVASLAMGWLVLQLDKVELLSTLPTLAHLLVLATAGVIAYTVLLMSLWTAGGRPAGPEEDILELIGRNSFASKYVAFLSGPKR